MEFACSSCVGVGFLGVLWFSPTVQTHADSVVSLTGDSKCCNEFFFLFACLFLFLLFGV